MGWPDNVRDFLDTWQEDGRWVKQQAAGEKELARMYRAVGRLERERGEEPGSLTPLDLPPDWDERRRPGRRRDPGRETDLEAGG
jgi:hypothetical protein